MSNRFFFRARLENRSPLQIGSGIANDTGSDVLLGSDDKPFIPGSTLAGLCRHFLDAADEKRLLEKLNSLDLKDDLDLYKENNKLSDIKMREALDKFKLLDDYQRLQVNEQNKSLIENKHPFLYQLNRNGRLTNLTENDLFTFNTSRLFGYTEFGKDEGHSSKINFYDARICDDKFNISIRDGVCLTDERTAKPGGKFDYEIIEAGSSFDFRLQIADVDIELCHKIVGSIIYGFDNDLICAGGKSTRGFGRFAVKEPKYLLLELPDNIEKFIGFKWDDVVAAYDDLIASFDGLSTGGFGYITREITFTLQSFLMIANKATLAVDANNDNKVIDAEQLLNARNEAVIPGTSWAGVFRHQFRRIMSQVQIADAAEIEEQVFGYVQEGEQRSIEQKNNKRSAAVSRIKFSETTLNESYLLNRTRNAVDRFTGGASDKKLFTVRPCFGGGGKLKISLRTDIEPERLKLVKSIIEVCISDLSAGYLVVGGNTAIGGGVLRLKGDNGEWK